MPIQLAPQLAEQVKQTLQETVILQQAVQNHMSMLHTLLSLGTMNHEQQESLENLGTVIQEIAEEAEPEEIIRLTAEDLAGHLESFELDSIPAGFLS